MYNELLRPIHLFQGSSDPFWIPFQLNFRLTETSLVILELKSSEDNPSSKC